MFKKILMLFRFLFFILCLCMVFTIVDITYLEKYTQYTHQIYEVYYAIINDYNIMLILFILYPLICVLSLISSLFSKTNSNCYVIKLKEGEISIKPRTLENFVKDYLLKNDLIESAKVNSYSNGSNIFLNIDVYTYNTVDISNKLLSIQENLLNEIEEKLLLKIKKVNLMISELKESNEKLNNQEIIKQETSKEISEQEKSLEEI